MILPPNGASSFVKRLDNNDLNLTFTPLACARVAPAAENNVSHTRKARKRDLKYTEGSYGRSIMSAAKPVVTRSPEILGGTPVFRGPRVPAKTLIDYLEAGDSLEVFLQDFPTVSREQAVAALQIAKEALLQDAGAA